MKKNVYICITESLCYTVEINTHCKTPILQQNKFKKPWPVKLLIDFIKLSNLYSYPLDSQPSPS